MRFFGSVPVGGGVRVGMSGYGAGPAKDDRTFRILMYVLAGLFLLLGAIYRTHHASSGWQGGAAMWDKMTAACAADGKVFGEGPDGWTCIK